MPGDIFKIEIKWLNNSDKKMKEDLGQLSKNTQKFVDRALNALGQRLQQLIQQNAPRSGLVNVGRKPYADSWTVMPPANNTITVRSPEGLLFNMLEFTGRKPGRIHGKPLLHFQIGGEDIFVHWVDHPGFGPKPHVRPAMRQLARESQKIIKTALAETIRIYGAK